MASVLRTSAKAYLPHPNNAASRRVCRLAEGSLFPIPGVSRLARGIDQRNGKRFGPYYRFAYRDGDRQRSIYLGRAGELVEEVRQRLAALHRPRTQYQAVQRLQRQVRASLRIEKRHLRSLLHSCGLRLKGFELRGIRISPLRRFLPRRRLMPRFSALKPPTLHPNRDPPALRMAKYLAARDRLQSS